MSVNIQAYRRAVTGAEYAFRQALAGGKESASGVAWKRVTWEIMLHDLTTAPNSVLVWERMPPSPSGLTGADAWTAAAQNKASEKINPQYGSPDQQARKYEEYLNLALEMLKWGQVRQELIVDKQRGRQYLILGADRLVGIAMQVVSNELMHWYRAQPNTRELIDQSARVGLARMLSGRPDLVALIRMAETLPLDVEISSVPVDRPAFAEVVELAIGLIPVVGNAVAAYEAWSGEDLFGYQLSDVERGVLAASVLLPVAGRLVKGGRALYTEARLVSMYGRDAAGWSRAIGASARGGAQRRALATVGEADRLLRVERTLSKVVVQEAADAVPRLAKGGAVKLTTTVDAAVTNVFRELTQAHPTLKVLDEYAIERVLAKGPNADHLKGQILEELIESRIVPWLRSREGGFALGITVPDGKKLEFIPGYLVRDNAGRQISDGLLVYREGQKLIIAAVFEAKAGKQAARELSLKKGGMSSLTKAERQELRANAKDVWREQREEALAAGKPFKKTLDEVEKEYALSELGGQIRRDVERLADGARIRVGTEAFNVTLSTTRTKFFGVLPRDVRSATIEKQLKESGFNYEIIGADIKSKDLTTISEKLQPLAEKLAEAAP